MVHHAVVNVLESLYEPCFLFDSYACRRGKGTHRAVRRAQHFARRYPYYLKTDLVKFFPSVDHQVLLDVLHRRIADPQLLELLRRIIASGDGVPVEGVTLGYFPNDDILALFHPRGLPIGNLTSQFFANVLLDPIDHFLKEELRIPGYVRYCDDLVLFADNKERLREARQRLEEKLAALRLRVHRDKTYVRPSRCGLKFLGYVIWPEQRRLQQGAWVRLNRRRRRWLTVQGRAASVTWRLSLQAWRAYARHANTVGVQRSLGRRVVRPFALRWHGHFCPCPPGQKCPAHRLVPLATSR